MLVSSDNGKPLTDSFDKAVVNIKKKKKKKKKKVVNIQLVAFTIHK